MTLASLGADRGVVLAAGPRPVLGSHDPAGASELAPYRAVGKLLAPLRLPDDELELLDIAGLATPAREHVRIVDARHDVSATK